MKKIAYLLTAVLILSIFAPFHSTVTFADENAALTRLNAVKMLAALLPSGDGGEEFADTADATAAYFRRLGIVKGSGDNLFMPDTPIRTQDFLLMLKRTLDAACPSLFYNNQHIIWHKDQNLVSPYAQNQVAMLSAVGVYNNSGYIRPDTTISVGMASYYVGLAKQAMSSAPKSSGGAAFWHKPPVLMYHVIDEPHGEYAYLYVSAKDFEAQVKYMYDNGYAFLFPEELSLANRLDKSVVITFDDGYEQMYTKAFPILKKYNAKATLYMISDLIDTEGYCSADHLAEMSDSGVFRIYSHTKSHTPLTTLSASEIEAEFAQSNDKIYNITKREVTSLAYPNGFFDDTVLSLARRYYKNAFSVNRGGSSMHSITRRTVDGTLGMNSFLSLLK